MKTSGKYLVAIRSFFLALIIAPVCGKSSAAPPDNGVLAAKMRHFVDDGTLAGAVMLVGSRDKILDVETIGYANIATKKPMQPDDLFLIASMTKAMTASAVMMLFDEGKLSLDDPVEKYLPEFKGEMVIEPADPTHTPHPPTHPITIREILSHTSGLPGNPPPGMPRWPFEQKPLAEMVASYAKIPLHFQPGTKYTYSNVGLAVAGDIVQVVSGMPYEKFMQQRLFDPLGMKDSTFFPSAQDLQRVPTPYQGTWTGLQEVPASAGLDLFLPGKNICPFPAGGLFSTAFDVAKFLDMFLHDGVYHGRRLLSPKAVQLMTTKETGPLVSSPYGFGWGGIKDGAFSHGGALKTYMGVDPGAGTYCVFMTQIEGAWGHEGNNVLPTFIQATKSFGESTKAAAPLHTEGQGGGP
jgi:CubicO group peptidase (beta-lactamase class C family)